MPKLRSSTTQSKSEKSLALYPYQREAVSFLERRDGLAGVFAEMFNA